MKVEGSLLFKVIETYHTYYILLFLTSKANCSVRKEVKKEQKPPFLPQKRQNKTKHRQNKKNLRARALDSILCSSKKRSNERDGTNKCISNFPIYLFPENRAQV